MKTVSDLTFKHPEIQSGEIFYCNMDEGNFRKLNWQTKRWGNRAYTYEGNSISSSSRPVFIKKSECDKRKVTPHDDYNIFDSLGYNPTIK
ncbi:MAG: hypothetical protein COV55_02475 [Candidatus Komeilibacteria bacterium CG11_big_fil_rev_8_21_14_0_20_36_20]|uniref:Uncharacterized protein n=1 Tax=Candidatus Komeilibacteria bacterium CG11_big_fil_rev_8_21_14_0_20_36_20 TaxID=1974477 RepID=A0A2H0ND40_9BACT|nr:MAG: hypothetical protein COV55_02475 [Candidatus Komeilibacteria bacterium CG11_big_fil_rev_8_21_14_0_20_36_20]PIR81839.1 MAG: hypothetical protein COU21_01535 [Candidatus Komeilibacteria bacterium CG10_big_fil_rev_8_21_14_0_10_36_65]PJC55330.1 MAG: hypothetical protein CO027_02875 [Candidatus Komeilibacteria bacterium CG_4_9_14_0_2_um_filter_36_13]